VTENQASIVPEDQGHVLSYPELSQIKVVVAHPMQLVGNLIVSALQRDSRFQALTSATSPDEFSILLQKQKPDVVLIGSESVDSGSFAIQMVRIARTISPRVRPILLIEGGDDRLIVDAFRAGVRGVLSRDDSVELLMQCIQRVHEGEIWARNSQLVHLVDVLVRESAPPLTKNENCSPSLTPRERDVVRGVADGLTNRDIAIRLEISEHTVKNYLFRLFERLGVSNRAELVACALQAQAD
jgi:DNA-binding NarL/FixJ family response regulator